MAPCLTQARWSVYGCQLNCVIALLPEGLSKWNCRNFNLPHKASECKERKGTGGLMCSIHEFFFFFLILSLLELGLCCCTRTFSCGEEGLLSSYMRGLLIVEASLVGF